MRFLGPIIVLAAAWLLSGTQAGADASGTAYGGVYQATVTEGRLSLVLAAQGGGVVLGRLDGLKGYVYQLEGRVQPNAALAGIARVGAASLYFTAVRSRDRLHMQFAEPDAGGAPNSATARQLTFFPVAAQTAPRTAVPAGVPIEQCRKTHSACITQCTTHGNTGPCMDRCRGQYDQCAGGRGGVSGGFGDCMSSCRASAGLAYGDTIYSACQSDCLKTYGSR